MLRIVSTRFIGSIAVVYDNIIPNSADAPLNNKQTNKELSKHGTTSGAKFKLLRNSS